MSRYFLLWLLFSLFFVVPSAWAYTQIDGGGLHTCALKNDGGIACWGDNRSAQLNVPAGRFSQVAAGSVHTCALNTDAGVVCWGWNYYGQLNAPAGSFIHVTAGSGHNCALKNDGSIGCWGDNQHGQVNVPTGNFSKVTTSALHTCAIATDSSILCWGFNSDGQANTPIGSFIQVAAGGFHTCALKSDATITCWGNNYYGQSTAPSGVFSQVTAGDSHSCALRADSSLTCWGDNRRGQTNAPEGNFTQVTAGGYHTCALKNDGGILCWGDNSQGQSSVPSDNSLASYNLSISTNGNGSVAGIGINCGNGNTDCSEPHTSGTSVTLTATPASGWKFTTWGGNCSGTSATTSVTMNAAKNCTATFIPTTCSYTIDPTYRNHSANEETGSVRVIPSNSSCADWSATGITWAPIKTVDKTSGNSGITYLVHGNSGTSSRSATMTIAGQTFTVNQAAPSTYSMQVTKVGSGTVTSTPAGISCGSDCLENFASGSTVTLTATPASGSLFSYWGGNCSGTSATITITMNSMKTCSATFAQPDIRIEPTTLNF